MARALLLLIPLLAAACERTAPDPNDPRLDAGPEVTVLPSFAPVANPPGSALGATIEISVNPLKVKIALAKDAPGNVVRGAFQFVWVGPPKGPDAEAWRLVTEAGDCASGAAPTDTKLVPAGVLVPGTDASVSYPIPKSGGFCAGPKQPASAVLPPGRYRAYVDVSPQKDGVLVPDRPWEGAATRIWSAPFVYEPRR